MVRRKERSKKRTNMLRDRQYNSKLKYIRRHIRNQWEENRGLPAKFTLHDTSHSENVEKAIYKLIPAAKYSEFSEEEKFYLLSSAWLHDIGMIPGLFGGQDDYKKLRSEHHKRSKRYIQGNRLELGLSGSQEKIINEICKYHRKSEDITKCDEEVRGDKGEVRLRLLASYLRLADAIHIDATRVDVSLFKIFLELGMDLESRYHWLKSFWTQDVSPDFDTLTITVHLKLRKTDDKNVGIIADMIAEEVRTELYTVRDILIRGGISYFLDVKYRYGIGIDDSQKIDLRQVIGNIQLARKPSASDVMDTIVSTILPILDLSDKRQAYSIIKTYQSELIKDIVKNRPCHMLVSKIHKIIEDNVKEDETDPSEHQIQARINRLKARIEKLKKSRERSLKKLFLHTKAILASGESVLLFGYSNLVIKALDGAERWVKEKTKIYVCECASKTQYNDMNEIMYSDGIEYASQIKKLGYKTVCIIPDILVGNLISRDLVSKIIFGGNGVDIETGTFGHTAGHLTIAELAHRHGVPVFVIIDSDKFGDMSHDEELERKINWITGDKKVLPKLEGIKLFNPREDKVKRDIIYALVTDYGIFPPNKIPDAIRRKVKAT